MSFSVPDFEQRLSSLQAQMDRLGHLPPGVSAAAEQRLALLADECAEIVRRWSVSSDRHARAVSRLEVDLGEWAAAGARLREETAQRLEHLETLMQREWRELRERHEEPVRQLHEHATSLAQVCLATASSAQQQFERSEARLAAIEEEIGRRLTDLSHQIHTVSSEIRAFQTLPAPSVADAAFSPAEGADAPTDSPLFEAHDEVTAGDAADGVIEDQLLVPVLLPGLDTLSAIEPALIEREAALEVTQSDASLSPAAADALSDRLAALEHALAERDAEREATQPVASLSPAAADALSDRLAALEHALAERDAEREVTQPVASLSPAAADALADRLATLERALGERGTEMRAASQQVVRDLRTLHVVVILVALLALASGLVAWNLHRDVKTALAWGEEARRDRGAISDTAAREAATARDAAAHALEEATGQAARARMIGEVLAAPDVVRYDLAGRDSLTGAAAQLRWSRSRGVVFSASRIPPPPPDSAYQVWLLTRAGVVRTVTFTPDEAGAVTLGVPLPQTSGAIIGGMVTIEPAVGSETPTGSAVLARPPEPDQPDKVPPTLR